MSACTSAASSAAAPWPELREPVEDVVGDPVALLLAAAACRRASSAASGSRRAGRAAAAATRCTLRPDSSKSCEQLRVGRCAAAATCTCDPSPRPPGRARPSRARSRSGSPAGNRSTALVSGRGVPSPMDAARNGDGVLRAGELEVRPASTWRSPRGRALSLSVRELELLAALARRQGRVVSARGALRVGVGRAAARPRPLGRRLRAQAARRSSDGRCRGGASSTRTSASATGSSRSRRGARRGDGRSHAFHSAATAS